MCVLFPVQCATTNSHRQTWYSNKVAVTNPKNKIAWRPAYFYFISKKKNMNYLKSDVDTSEPHCCTEWHVAFITMRMGTVVYF